MNSERLASILLMPIMPGVMAFSHETKREIYERADGRCDLCELPVKFKEAEFHHDVPQCRGGSDRPENGKCVHGEHSYQDCHEIADRKVLDHGICMDGKPISEQEPEKFKANKYIPRVSEKKCDCKKHKKHKHKH